MDRGRLHRRGVEVGDAAAGALPLHQPAGDITATIRRRRRGESAGLLRCLFFNTKHNKINTSYVFSKGQRMTPHMHHVFVGNV